MHLDIYGRKCGRPTKAGTPCKNKAYDVYHLACMQHSTDEEKTHAAQLQEWVTWRLESSKPITPVAQPKPVVDLERHYTDASGNQLVTVDNKLGYAWRGTPLQVGEKVVLPKTYWQYDNTVGTVTALGSTYDGQHVHALRRHTLS